MLENVKALEFGPLSVDEVREVEGPIVFRPWLHSEGPFVIT